MALPSTIQAILTRFRGTNNNAYNATSNPLGMGQGGHRQNFGPRLKDTADVVDWMSGAVDAVDVDAQATAADRVQTGQDRTAIAASAGAAAQSVTDAAAQVQLAADQAAKLVGTSTTSNTPSVASKTFTTQAGKAFDVGTTLLIQSRSNIDRFMSGRVTAYSGTSLTVSVEGIGSVTSAATDWDIRVSGIRGLQGLQGIPGIATMPYVARTSNTQIVAANSATIFDLTGTFTQTFAACAVLGANWYAVLRNAGTGDITLDPNGSETIDGLASFIMYPGEVRLIQCDGTALRSLVLEGGTKSFAASGNLIWPPGVNGAIVRMRGGEGGGGGSGASVASANATGSGGGGGALPEEREQIVAPSVAGTSVAVAVGSGGAGGAGAEAATSTTASAGSAGGASQFGDITVQGGAPGNGGRSPNPNQQNGGAGGASASASTLGYTARSANGGANGNAGVAGSSTGNPGGAGGSGGSMQAGLSASNGKGATAPSYPASGAVVGNTGNVGLAGFVTVRFF